MYKYNYINIINNIMYSYKYLININIGRVIKSGWVDKIKVCPCKESAHDASGHHPCLYAHTLLYKILSLNMIYLYGCII